MTTATLSSPCSYVIFGATGNLSQVKLMPALYHLEVAGRLPEETMILATGRRPWNREIWIEQVKKMVVAKARGGVDEAIFSRFVQRLDYHQVDLNQAEGYQSLAIKLDQENFPSNIAFYLSIKPSDFGVVIQNLSEVELLQQPHGWRRVIIEKPFGYDTESARALQKRLNRYLEEEQIYRIDHYLGKGTVQNVLVFRFANVLMEPLWNRNYIDHVQITHSENLGVGTRGYYYDTAGALRDMIQSHLLQLMALVAMEPPVSMEAEALRDEKVKVLKSIRPIPQHAVHAQAFRAQYRSGQMPEEGFVSGYLEEEGIPKDSVTETYAALRLYIDNWRWRGVPFYLRTGKRLKKSQSAIAICFKHPPQQLFRNTQIEQLHPNWINLGIQPEERLTTEINVKQPGLTMKTRTINMDASFRSQHEAHTDAYEDLLLDVIEGDRSLFLRYDEVATAWQVVDPVLQVWSMERDYIRSYPAGSWGPKEANRLFEREDQYWRYSLDCCDELKG